MRQKASRRLSSLNFDRNDDNDDLEVAGDGAMNEDDNNEENDAADDDDDDNNDGSKPLKKARKSTSSTSSTATNVAKLTPLETQYVKIRDKNPGVILAVECGYKYQVRKKILFGLGFESIRLCAVF